jgi:hypothetical protein
LQDRTEGDAIVARVVERIVDALAAQDLAEEIAGCPPLPGGFDVSMRMNWQSVSTASSKRASQSGAEGAAAMGANCTRLTATRDRPILVAPVRRVEASDAERP